MSNFISDKLLKRGGALFYSVLFICLFLAPTGMAQTNQCSLVNRLNNIEANIAELASDVQSNGNGTSSQALTILAQNLINMIRQIESRQIQVLVADQVTHRSNWTRDYLHSRNDLASLYLTQDWPSLRQRLASRNFRQISDDLIKINRVTSCLTGNSRNSGPDQQPARSREDISQTPSNYDKAQSGTLASIAQLISALTKIISQNTYAIVPVVVMAITIAGIWQFVRLDDYRTQCRQRFHCHIDILLSGANSSQKGYIIDISRSGVGLVVEESVTVGAEMTLIAGNWQKKIRVVKASGNTVGAVFLKRLKRIPKNFDLSGSKKWRSNKEFTKKKKTAARNAPRNRYRGLKRHNR